MRIRTLAAALMTATTMSVVSPPAMAQGGASGGASSGLSEDRRFITLEFAGGPLDAFVRQIRKSAGESPVNILYPPEFSDLQLPAMTFEQVEVSTALRVAAGLSASRTLRMPDGREAWWEVSPVGGGRGAPVFLISVYAEELDEEHDEHEHEEYYERFTMVHSLAGLIAGEHALGADAVLSSIEIALEMVDQGDTDLRFHEDTGLLFARVTEDQHHAMEQTVGRLMESASDFRRANAQSELERFLKRLGFESTDAALISIQQGREAVESAERMRREVSDMERSVRAEFDASKRRLVQMEQELALMHTQLREARTIAEELERQNQRLEAERQDLRNEIEALRAQLERRQ